MVNNVRNEGNMQVADVPLGESSDIVNRRIELADRGILTGVSTVYRGVRRSARSGLERTGLIGLRNAMFGAQRYPKPILVGVVAIAILITVLNERFLTYTNITNMAQSGALLGIVALAQTIVLIGGGFDLSIGAMAAVTGVVTAEALNAGMPPAAAVGVAVLCGGCLGLLNGIIIGIARINPIIATLATASIYYGSVLMYTKGVGVVYPLGDLAFAGARLRGFSFSFLVYVALLFLMGFVLHLTVFGWRLYGVGANRAAARANGIRVTTIEILSYVISGLLAGCAGVLLDAELGSAIANVGEDWLLISIAAPIIGGVAVTGGSGTVFGGFLGIVLLTEIGNGLVLTGYSSYSRGTALGIAILFAMLAQSELRALARYVRRS